MRHSRYDTTPGCAVEAALEVMGGKWKGAILYHLSDMTLRFGELRRRMPGITQRMLTQQLRELEADAVVNRKVFAQVPPRVDYSLTEFGRTLEPLIEQIRQWGEVYLTTRQTSDRQHLKESKSDLKYL